MIVYAGVWPSYYRYGRNKCTVKLMKRYQSLAYGGEVNLLLDGHRDLANIYCEIYTGDSDRVSAAYKLKNLAMRTKLYRYRTISERTLLELERGHIFMASAKDLDDPLDTNFLQRPVPHEIKAALSELPVSMRASIIKALEGQRKANWKLNHEQMRLCCFTEQKDNMCMWEFYANKRAGMCIEYDMTRMKNDSDIRWKCMFPVIFDKMPSYIHDTKPYSDGEAFDNAMRSALSDDNLWKEGATGLVVRTHKRVEWAWLEEWRLINTPFGFDIDPNESLKNWINRIQKLWANHVITDNFLNFSDVISAVYLGDKVDSFEAKKIRDIADEHKMEIHQMRVDSGEVKFEQL